MGDVFLIYLGSSQSSGPMSDLSATVPTKTGHCQGQRGTQQRPGSPQPLSQLPFKTRKPSDRQQRYCQDPESQSPGLKELAALVGVVTLPQCHLPPASCLPGMLRTEEKPLVSWRSYGSHRANDNHPPVGNTAPISDLNPHAKGRGSNRVS